MFSVLEPVENEFKGRSMHVCSFYFLFTRQVKPLIWIESVIEKHSHSRIEYMIKAGPFYHSCHS